MWSSSDDTKPIRRFVDNANRSKRTHTRKLARSDVERSYRPGRQDGPINRLLYETSEFNRYATFFYAELDCESRTLHYVNAGHNPPAVLRKESGAWQVLRLEGGVPAIELLERASYMEQKIQLLPSDTLLNFSDGISETMNATGDEWGESE